VNGLSLFSSIGGLDLGLERAGVAVVGQVELDLWRRQVLARHWPDVPRHDDVRTAADWWLDGEDRPHVDLVFGGFPCQPFSLTGLRLGVADERWMWPAMAAVIRLVRPRYVLLENVPALLACPGVDAWGWVLSDLADLGFDAEWSVFSACAVGAPHPRRRLFALAYPAGQGRPPRWPERRGPGASRGQHEDGAEPAGGSWWAVEPGVGRVAYGVPGRVDRCGALGDAVVPQVAEHVGRLLLDFDRRWAA